MFIKIVDAPCNPMDVISIAAGTSYGKDDIKHSRVKTCYERGHMSVFEHAHVTFRVGGISRACSHQLVRHRMASFVQVSQRYTKPDLYSDDWYVIPPAINGNPELLASYQFHMSNCAVEYDYAIKKHVKPEDARFLLPEATCTELTCTMNVRELFHFLDLRTDQSAQWEIREMAFALYETVSSLNDQWDELMGYWHGEE